METTKEVPSPLGDSSDDMTLQVPPKEIVHVDDRPSCLGDGVTAGGGEIHVPPSNQVSTNNATGGGRGQQDGDTTTPPKMEKEETTASDDDGVNDDGKNAAEYSAEGGAVNSATNREEGSSGVMTTSNKNETTMTMASTPETMEKETDDEESFCWDNDDCTDDDNDNANHTTAQPDEVMASVDDDDLNAGGGKPKGDVNSPADVAATTNAEGVVVIQPSIMTKDDDEDGNNNNPNDQPPGDGNKKEMSYPPHHQHPHHFGHHPTFSQRWTSAIDTVRILICRFLKVLSHSAATHPWTTVVAVVVVSLAMIMAGLNTNFEIEVESDTLWPPTRSPSAKYNDWIQHDSHFPKPSEYAFLYIHANGDNMLLDGMESVSKAFDVLEAIQHLPDFSTICGTTPQEILANCNALGLFEFWFYSRDVFESSAQTDDDVIAQLSATTFPTGKPVDPDRTYGNPVYDGPNGTLTHVEAYRMEFFFPPTEEAFEFLTPVTETILDLQKTWDNAGLSYQVEIFTSRSFDDEFEAAIVKDIPLMPLAFIVMSAFCCVVFFKCDRVKSQSLLGFGAVASVLFSIFTGYGLMFLIGIPLTSVTQIVVFVIFGIGLDDAFVISGSYSRTDPNKDPVERVADTIDDIGLSITITTLTSALAFAAGCISSINGVFWLCLYAFPTIIIDFLYQITFFLALVVIDERRMQRNRMDWLVCVTVAREPEEEVSDITTNANDDVKRRNTDDNNNHETLQGGMARRSLSDRVMRWYADRLMYPWVKATVLVAFTALLGACIYGTTQLRQKFDFKDMVPSGSFVSAFFVAQEAYSPTAGFNSLAYFRHLNQSDPTVRQEMMTYLEHMAVKPPDAAEAAITSVPTYIWFQDFDSFVAQNFANTTTATFNEQLDAFLEDPLYNMLYEDMIVRDEESGDIINSRVLSFMIVETSSVNAGIDHLALVHGQSGEHAINADINQADYNAFVYQEYMGIWEFYTAVPNELVFTTVVGVVSVTVIAAAFIPHWTAVLFVLPSIMTVYIDLLGFLYFVGVPINPVSYVTLVMSVGLLVDFIVHILIRYYECKGSREERVKETLVTMGSSILTGGISTFLGVMLLSASTSEIFSYIFRSFVGLVLLGCSYGLVLLPVVLSLVGPEDSHTDENDLDEDPAATTTNTTSLNVDVTTPASLPKKKQAFLLASLSDVSEEISV